MMDKILMQKESNQMTTNCAQQYSTNYKDKSILSFLSRTEDNLNYRISMHTSNLSPSTASDYPNKDVVSTYDVALSAAQSSETTNTLDTNGKSNGEPNEPRTIETKYEQCFDAKKSKNVYDIENNKRSSNLHKFPPYYHNLQEQQHSPAITHQILPISPSSTSFAPLELTTVLQQQNQSNLLQQYHLNFIKQLHTIQQQQQRTHTTSSAQSLQKKELYVSNYGNYLLLPNLSTAKDSNISNIEVTAATTSAPTTSKLEFQKVWSSIKGNSGLISQVPADEDLNQLQTVRNEINSSDNAATTIADSKNKQTKNVISITKSESEDKNQKCKKLKRKHSMLKCDSNNGFGSSLDNDDADDNHNDDAIEGNTDYNCKINKNNDGNMRNSKKFKVHQETVRIANDDDNQIEQLKQIEIDTDSTHSNFSAKKYNEQQQQPKNKKTQRDLNTMINFAGNDNINITYEHHIDNDDDNENYDDCGSSSNTTGDNFSQLEFSLSNFSIQNTVNTNTNSNSNKHMDNNMSSLKNINLNSFITSNHTNINNNNNDNTNYKINLNKYSLNMLSSMQQSQIQYDEQFLFFDQLKNLQRFGSHLECKMEQCRCKNLREHFHCYDVPCFGKSLNKKEEIIRHLKWHKKRNESLSYGFLRFSSSDDCAARFGPICPHNRKQTHYHCLQPKCDKVYISTSDVQMHSNYHRKDTAIFQEGFQRFRANEKCNTSYCSFAGQKTTHFHCRRENCIFTFKNKADMEKHKTYHIKDMQLARDGFKKFLKNEPCPYQQCRFSRVCNHIHCVRNDCFYILHSSGQLLSHKRKHDRIDGELSYQNYKILQLGEISGNLDLDNFNSIQEDILPLSYIIPSASTSSVNQVFCDMSNSGTSLGNTNKFNQAAEIPMIVNQKSGQNPTMEKKIKKKGLFSADKIVKNKKASHKHSKLHSGKSFCLDYSNGSSLLNNDESTDDKDHKDENENLWKIDFPIDLSLIDNNRNCMTTSPSQSRNHEVDSRGVGIATIQTEYTGSPSISITNLKNLTKNLGFVVKQYFTTNCSRQQQYNDPNPHCDEISLILTNESEQNNDNDNDYNVRLSIYPSNAITRAKHTLFPLLTQQNKSNGIFNKNKLNISQPYVECNIENYVNEKAYRDASDKYQKHYHCLYKSCPKIIYDDNNITALLKHIRFHESGNELEDFNATASALTTAPKNDTKEGRTDEVVSKYQMANQMTMSDAAEVNGTLAEVYTAAKENTVKAATLDETQRQVMHNQSNLTQITSIEGFFNRKRGRPPKNRVVELYGNKQQSPQAIFTSFKLERANEQQQPIFNDNNDGDGLELEPENVNQISLYPDQIKATLLNATSDLYPFFQAQEQQNPTKLSSDKSCSISLLSKSNEKIKVGVENFINDNKLIASRVVAPTNSVVRASGTYFPKNTLLTNINMDRGSSCGKNSDSDSNNLSLTKNFIPAWGFSTSRSLTEDSNTCNNECRSTTRDNLLCKAKQHPHQHCDVFNKEFYDLYKLKKHYIKKHASKYSDGPAFDEPQDLSFLATNKIMAPVSGSNSNFLSPTPIETIALQQPPAMDSITEENSRKWIEQLFDKNIQKLHLAHLLTMQQQSISHPFHIQCLANAMERNASAAGDNRMINLEMSQQNLCNNPYTMANGTAVAAFAATVGSYQQKQPKQKPAACNPGFNALFASPSSPSSSSSQPPLNADKMIMKSIKSNLESYDTISTSNLLAGSALLNPAQTKVLLQQQSIEEPTVCTAGLQQQGMFKDEPVPNGYLKFRFNEDCNFHNCGYRNHQSHFHCIRNDCYYSFCDKTRFVQHTARHERLDKLMGDDFKQFRANMRCNYVECMFNKNFAEQNNKSSHFHCLKCDFICSDTNKVVAHRRQHSKAEFFRMAGFRKVSNNENCSDTGTDVPTACSDDEYLHNMCPYLMKQTHYHCLTCNITVLSRAQLTSHKHRLTQQKKSSTTKDRSSNASSLTAE